MKGIVMWTAFWIRKRMKIGTKCFSLCNGEYLYFWYANNAGRGRDNCTICRVVGHDRATTSARQDGVISFCRTSAWRGNVNFSNAVYDSLFV